MAVFVCSCVFFFKQKTAYELRISDWSSDVCSSDLKSADVDLSDVPEPVLNAPGHGYNIFVTGIGGTGVLTISALLGMAAHLEGKASTTEIGRASFRERVCQYV